MNRGQRDAWDALALASGLGLTAAIVVAAGVYFGGEVDARLHTGPLFALVGLFIGVGTGVWSFVRFLRRMGGR